MPYMACKGSGVQIPSAPLVTTAQVAALYCCSTSPPRAPRGRLRPGVETRLRDLGPPVGPQLVERMMDDLPHMAVGGGEEPIGPAQRGGRGPLDHDPAGSGRRSGG